MEKANHQIACCGCLLTNEKHERIHSFGSFHTLTNVLQEKCWIFEKLFRLFGLCKTPKYDNPKFENSLEFFEVPFVTGAALFIRKEVSDKYGLFDSDYFMYSEDMDLQYRYSKYGFKSVIIKTPQIIHLFGKSSKKGSVKKKEMNIKGVFLYMKKHYSSVYFFFFSVLFKLFYSFSFLLSRKYTIKEKILHIKFITLL